MAENGVSSSDNADSSQRPSTSTGPPDAGTSPDVGSASQGFKQECDSLESQFSSNPSKAPNAPPSLYSSSSSSSPSSSSAQRPSQSTQCVREPKPARVSPRTVIMSRAAYSLLAGESGSQLSSFSLLPHADVAWSSPLRPLVTPNLQGPEQSAYYREWTVARQHHADYEAPAVPHPRRLLLSGPPQVTKHKVQPPSVPPRALKSTDVYVIAICAFECNVTRRIFLPLIRWEKLEPICSSSASCFECSSDCWKSMCMMRKRRRKKKVKITEPRI